jgi:hypothetical protein
VFYVDETDTSAVPNKSSKIIRLEGKKIVRVSASSQKKYEHGGYMLEWS